MNKLLKTLLLYCFIPMPLLAQHYQSVLWEISGNGLKNKSYVFGTEHCTAFSLLDSFPGIKKVISQCTYGLFEKGGNDIGNVRDTVVYTPPLDSVFTKEEYAIVDSFFTSSPYGSIKPHNNNASLQAMAQAIVMLKQTPGQEMFFDEFIQTYMTDSLHRKVFQLDEPVQMAREEKPPVRQFAEVILFLIRETENTIYADTTYFDKKLYQRELRQDMKLLTEIPESMKNATERNFIWLPKIQAKLAEQPCFIAVGLGHLQYKDGLIRLLRQKGYTVQPLELKKYKRR